MTNKKKQKTCHLLCKYYTFMWFMLLITIICLARYVKQAVSIKNYNNSRKIKLLKLFSIMIRKPSWAVNQHITMISDGSCDTEDWSNYSENSALKITEINYILQYIYIENTTLSCTNILQYYCFYCIFDKINAYLVSQRDFFQNTGRKTSCRNPFHAYFSELCLR